MQLRARIKNNSVAKISPKYSMLEEPQFFKCVQFYIKTCISSFPPFILFPIFHFILHLTFPFIAFIKSVQFINKSHFFFLDLQSIRRKSAHIFIQKKYAKQTFGKSGSQLKVHPRGELFLSLTLTWS